MKKNSTLDDFQEFALAVYDLPNDRHFSTEDMLVNIQRFLMRGLKGIRKNDDEKVNANLVIALSWTMSLLNRLHIRIDEELWKRFPYICHYCGTCPCSCKDKKVKTRKKIRIEQGKKPETIKDFQEMFEKIYPSEKRSIQQAGVHLAEESGELAEAVLSYRGEHDPKYFENIKVEAADMITCIFGVFNSLKIDAAKELSKLFSKNCHECKNAPCSCNFGYVMKFKS